MCMYAGHAHTDSVRTRGLTCTLIIKYDTGTVHNKIKARSANPQRIHSHVTIPAAALVELGCVCVKINT